VATYWIGNNGNVYLKDGSGVKDLGKANPSGIQADGSYSAQYGSGYATRIANPSGPVQSGGSSAPRVSSGGGGGAPAPVLNQAGISNTQLTIDQLPGLLEAALAAEATKYGNTIKEFDVQEQGQRKTYDQSTTTNQLNYDSNFMDSIRAGIKGLGGLMNLLRGTGAAGGTAEDQARETVGGVTANDIRTGADTRQENQTALDTSLSGFISELQRKRQLADDTRVNNERAVRRDSDTLLQDLFSKMAGFYGEAGDTNNANSWMARAGEITPRIAANSRTQVSPYDTSPVTVKAPELAAFADPTQPSVTIAPDGQVGSGIFTMNERRRREEAVPVGA